MKALIQKFKNFFRDERGATAVEYGLFVAAIAAVIVAVVFALGGKVGNAFNKINSSFGNVTDSGTYSVPDIHRT